MQMTFVLLSSILFGNSTLVRLHLTLNPHRIQVDTQQMRLQSLFIKCETKCNSEMIAPQIKEMIRKKIIIRRIKERMKKTKRKDNKILNGMKQSVIPALMAW
jgi:hypothetical protein